MHAAMPIEINREVKAQVQE